MPREWFALSEASAMGHVVTIRCAHCRRQHHHDPADLLRILGERPVGSCAERMRCESCNTGDYLRVRVHIPSAEERQHMKLRRIKAIRTVRKIVWVEE